MLIRVSCLLAILQTSLLLKAQPKMDSLHHNLAILRSSRPNFVNDTVRFQMLVNLADQTKSWQQGRDYWQQAIDLAEKRNWIPGLLKSYKGMGLHYRRKGSFLESAYYFQRGLHFSEQTNDYRYQVDCYQSLGVAYSTAGDTGKSLAAHRLAVKLAHAVDHSLYLSCLNDIGNVFFHARDYSKALTYYNQCIRENVPVDSTRHYWFLVNTAASYQELNKLETSLKTYKELFRYAKYFSKEDSIEFYARLGYLYVKKGKTGLGLTYGLAANRIGLDVENYYPRSLASQTLAEAYKAMGHWKEAFSYERQFHLYKDSILSQEQRQRLEGVKVGYESERRRTELMFLNGKIQIQQQANQLLWAGMALLGILGVVLIFFNYLLQKRRKEIEYQKNEVSKINNSLELRVEERTTELQRANIELTRKNRDIEEALLKGQTLERKRVASELHDNLGGTLTAIQWYMESLLLSNEASNHPNQNYDDLYSMITRAYGEVRLLAHHMMPEVLEKEGLEGALHELAIPINKSKRLHLFVDTKIISPYLTIKQKFELYSIALELCTNILKHARASEAYLQLDCTDSEISMSVSDNGIGMPTDTQQQNMGLKNIQSRLETIGGHYTIRSIQNEGTMVLIKIPLTNSPLELQEIGNRKPTNS